MPAVTVEIKKHKTDANMSVLKLNNAYHVQTPEVKTAVDETLKGYTTGFKTGDNSCMWFVPKAAAQEAAKKVNKALEKWAFSSWKSKVVLASELDKEEAPEEDEEDEEEDEEDEEEAWPSENFWYHLTKVCDANGLSEIRLLPGSNLIVAINKEGLSVSWKSFSADLKSFFEENC